MADQQAPADYDTIMGPVRIADTGDGRGRGLFSTEAVSQWMPALKHVPIFLHINAIEYARNCGVGRDHEEGFGAFQTSLDRLIFGLETPDTPQGPDDQDTGAPPEKGKAEDGQRPEQQPSQSENEIRRASMSVYEQARGKTIDPFLLLTAKLLDHGSWPSSWRRTVAARGDVAAHPLMRLLSEASGKTAAECFALYELVRSNALPVTSVATVSVGGYILLVGPMCAVNHSCEPNCLLTVRGGMCRLVASRPIAAGEELTVGYLRQLRFNRFGARQARLRETWGFVCRCRLCAAKGPDFQNTGDTMSAIVHRNVLLDGKTPIAVKDLKLLKKSKSGGGSGNSNNNNNRKKKAKSKARASNNGGRPKFVPYTNGRVSGPFSRNDFMRVETIAGMVDTMVEGGRYEDLVVLVNNVLTKETMYRTEKPLIGLQLTMMALNCVLKNFREAPSVAENGEDKDDATETVAAAEAEAGAGAATKTSAFTEGLKSIVELYVRMYQDCEEMLRDFSEAHICLFMCYWVAYARLSSVSKEAARIEFQYGDKTHFMDTMRSVFPHSGVLLDAMLLDFVLLRPQEFFVLADLNKAYHSYEIMNRGRRAIDDGDAASTVSVSASTETQSAVERLKVVEKLPVGETVFPGTPEKDPASRQQQQQQHRQKQAVKVP